MSNNILKNNNLLFLIALVAGLGIAYVAIDQAYSTGEAVSAKPGCFDSDKGLNYSVAGYVQSSIRRGVKNKLVVSKDFCANNYLFEGYCDSKGLDSFEVYICPNGCKGGACVKT